MEAISDLKTTIDDLFDWFCYNKFKANPSKCHLLLSLFNLKCINIKSFSIEESPTEKSQLMAILYSRNTWTNYAEKATKTQPRCAKYMSVEKKYVLSKTFAVSQSN